MATKKKDKLVKAHVTEETEAKLKAYCEENDMSMSELIRRAVNWYVYVRENGSKVGPEWN